MLDGQFKELDKDSINCQNLDFRTFVVCKALKKEASNFPVEEMWAICGNAPVLR